MSKSINNLLFSEILTRAEAEIAAAEKDIQQWKQSKFLNSHKAPTTETDLESPQKLESEDFSYFQPKSSINQLEKRLKTLEISLETDSAQNSKKISKLEKIVDEIVEKSISPKKSEPKIRIHKKSRAKSSIGLSKPKQKNVKYCVYVKDLENDAEKWKNRAKLLQKKCCSEIKLIKKQLSSMKSEIQKEAQEIKQYYNSLINTEQLP